MHKLSFIRLAWNIPPVSFSFFRCCLFLRSFIYSFVYLLVLCLKRVKLDESARARARVQLCVLSHYYHHPFPMHCGWLVSLFRPIDEQHNFTPRTPCVIISVYFSFAFCSVINKYSLALARDMPNGYSHGIRQYSFFCFPSFSLSVLRRCLFPMAMCMWRCTNARARVCVCVCMFNQHFTCFIAFFTSLDRMQRSSLLQRKANTRICSDVNGRRKNRRRRRTNDLDFALLRLARRDGEFEVVTGTDRTHGSLEIDIKVTHT